MHTRTKRVSSFVGLLLTAVALATLAPSVARGEEQGRTIEVTGEGKVSAKPDLAVVTAGVTTQAPQAQEALAQNNEAMTQVVATLKDRGVAAKDIQTSQFDVSPVYEHNRDQAFNQGRERQEAPKLVAYRVTNQVTVDVRKIDELGQILDALVQAGGNDISGIQFAVDDPAKLLEEARAKAVQEGRRRAETLAQAADVQLGPVLRIQESGAGFPQPTPYRSRQMAFAAAESVPIESGEQEFTVTVNLTYAIGGGGGEAEGHAESP
ncbi:MAG TPA: SIMPL domain-containing protein [Pirellulaceae bacterium]|jgi:hypothetical protein|nr:SIMPL domain-containing protein [Pirellulaceae bacterium]